MNKIRKIFDFTVALSQLKEKGVDEKTLDCFAALPEDTLKKILDGKGSERENKRFIAYYSHVMGFTSKQYPYIYEDITVGWNVVKPGIKKTFPPMHEKVLIETNIFIEATKDYFKVFGTRNSVDTIEVNGVYTIDNIQVISEFVRRWRYYG